MARELSFGGQLTKTFLRIVVLLTGIAAFLGAATAFAGVTATISGVVRDQSGAVIPGVEVIATNVQTGVKTAVVTDEDGFYSLQALPVGTYNVEMRKTGLSHLVAHNCPTAVRSAANEASDMTSVRGLSFKGTAP